MIYLIPKVSPSAFAPILNAITANDAARAAATPLPPSKIPNAFPCPSESDIIRTAFTHAGQKAKRDENPQKAYSATNE